MATENSNEMPSSPSIPRASKYCFQPEDFLAPNFSIDAFLVAQRLRVPMQTLRSDLEEYYTVLKSAMVELINKDYADFVNLSSNLVGMDKSLVGLSVPLTALAQEIQQVKEALDSEIASVAEKIKTRNETREKKQLLQRSLAIVASLEKIEKLLNVSQSTSTSDSKEAEGGKDGKAVERAATEFNELMFYHSQCKAMPFVKSLTPRIDHVRGLMEASLAEAFTDGVRRGATETLRHVLRTYCIVEAHKMAEAIFVQLVVRPALEKIITRDAVKTNGEGLGALFEHVLTFIDTTCAPVLEASQAEGVQGFDFLVNNIWPEIVEALFSRLPFIFSSGIADVFHSNYTAAVALLDALETRCALLPRVHLFRTSRAYTSFRQRWSLPVYFQLRFQELAGGLESALVAAPTCSSEPERHARVLVGLDTPLLRTLASLLELVWDDSIFVLPLAHRFWKLFIQMIARYSKWLLAGCEGKGDIVLSSDRIAFMLSLRVDTKKLTTMLPSFYEQVVLTKIKTYAQAVGPAVLDAHIELNKLLEDGLRGLQATITRFLSNECASPLKNAKLIPQQYRKTNKPAPAQASSYVINILIPLQSFCEKYGGGDLLSNEELYEWILMVLRSVNERYLAIAKDVVTSVQKIKDSLSSLKKLRDGKKDESGGNNQNGAGAKEEQPLSDDDKILLQLSIDIKDYVATAQNLLEGKQEEALFADLLALAHQQEQQLPAQSS